MKSIIILFLTMSLLLTQVSAFVFTEIMYDPIGTDANREWVEVYGLPLTDISFVEDGYVHSLSLVQGTCLDNCVSIIADDATLFLAEYTVEDTVLVYDSSWSSLKNTGETIGLVENGLVVLELSYFPVVGESFQLVDGEYVGGDVSAGVFETNILETTQEVPEFGTVAAIFVLIGAGIFVMRKRS